MLKCLDFPLFITNFSLLIHHFYSMFDILQLLRDPSHYNYLVYLQKVPLSLELSENDQKLINTLELFAYGDYKHYEKYRPHYVELDRTLLEKLVKLTVVSLAMDHENLSISRSVLVAELGGALRVLARMSASGTPEEAEGTEEIELALEEVLIAMVDDNIVNVKVDDVKETLEFGNVVTFRDSYSSQYGKLRVLTEDDICSRSLEGAVVKLERWMETKLKPIKREFTGEDIAFDPVINERKRKAALSS